MHQLNVLILGPESFISTLNELKSYLKFNFYTDINNLSKTTFDKYDVLFLHKQILEDKESNNIIKNISLAKVLATENIEKDKFYYTILKLPASINEINSIIEVSAAKKIFNKNSSIEINDFILNKNERKLTKDNKFVILTEKEVQLLELLMSQKKPITKKNILSFVWQYSSEADTHTVETHIYRLRKKISNKFLDEKFILINKDGYYL